MIMLFVFTLEPRYLPDDVRRFDVFQISKSKDCYSGVKLESLSADGSIDTLQRRYSYDVKHSSDNYAGLTAGSTAYLTIYDTRLNGYLKFNT